MLLFELNLNPKPLPRGLIAHEMFDFISRTSSYEVIRLARNVLVVLKKPYFGNESKSMTGTLSSSRECLHAK
jgi:hypothetical protein